MIYDNRVVRQVTYRNFNGLYTSQSDFFAAPTSLQEMREIVEDFSPRKIRCSGSQHVFNALSLTDGLTLRTDNLRKILHIDTTHQTATIEAGVTVATLNDALAEQNLALPVQMATSRPTVVGAAATGAHGSDISRSASVSSLIQGGTLVLANGQAIEVTSDLLPAFQCHLGCLGAVYSVTVQCEPLFGIEEQTESLSQEDFLQQLPKIQEEFPLTQVELNLPTRHAIILKRRKVENGTNGYEQLTSSQPSHFYIEAEVALPIHKLRDGIETTRDFWKEQATLPLTESLLIRFSGPDPSWLGMASHQKTVHISCFFDDPTEAEASIENLRQWTNYMMTTLEARCHYGKINALTNYEMPSLYPETYYDFAILRQTLDPDNVFTNPVIDALF
jgi:FAD/FMN-containing dehydrogenase